MGDQRGTACVWGLLFASAANFSAGGGGGFRRPDAVQRIKLSRALIPALALNASSSEWLLLIWARLSPSLAPH